MGTLIIDETPADLKALKALAGQAGLKPVHATRDVAEALALLETVALDLVFVGDVADGVDLIRAIRERQPADELPIVLVAPLDRAQARANAVEAGANDVLAKPIDATEFRVRVANLTRLRDAGRQLRDRSRWLAREVRKVTSALSAGEEEIILRLAHAAEHRDPESGAHILRMARYCALISEAMGCSKVWCRNMFLAAPMHDIGKVAVSDAILSKPGPLTADERRDMERHALVGKEILDTGASELVRLAAEIAMSHHERWDGSGYPLGLQGTEIPLSGRIAAVADVFDALTSERPYKRAWGLEEARNFLVENSGRHFDPACVDAFLSRWDEVVGIRGGERERNAA